MFLPKQVRASSSEGKMYNQDSIGPVLEKSNGDLCTTVLLTNHAADIYIYIYICTYIYIYTHTTWHI